MRIRHRLHRLWPSACQWRTANLVASSSAAAAAAAELAANTTTKPAAAPVAASPPPAAPALRVSAPPGTRRIPFAQPAATNDAFPSPVEPAAATVALALATLPGPAVTAQAAFCRHQHHDRVCRGWRRHVPPREPPP